LQVELDEFALLLDRKEFSFEVTHMLVRFETVGALGGIEESRDQKQQDGTEHLGHVGEPVRVGSLRQGPIRDPGHELLSVGSRATGEGGGLWLHEPWGES
jgi:hypothetical protein